MRLEVIIILGRLASFSFHTRSTLSVAPLFPTVEPLSLLDFGLGYQVLYSQIIIHEFNYYETSLDVDFTEILTLKLTIFGCLSEV